MLSIYVEGDDVRVQTRQDGVLIEGKGKVAGVVDGVVLVHLEKVYQDNKTHRQGTEVPYRINEVTLLEHV